jgi:hypothetical protein
VDRETLGTIAERYPWASWAVWDDVFPDGDHVEALTPGVVLTGLNRSDDLRAPFSNFHAPTRKHYDYRLKEFIQDGGLRRFQGAYMTDLVVRNGSCQWIRVEGSR